MSDNEDERMDRAERIRKMREGGDRTSDDESSGDGTESSDTVTESSGDGTESSDTVTESSGDVSTGSADDTAGTGTEEWVSGADKLESDGKSGSEADSTDPSLGDGGQTETGSGRDSGDSPGVEDDISAPLPDTEQLESALETDQADSETETVAPEEVAGAEGAGQGVGEGEDISEEETRVLEFTLADEFYCLDIEYIEEIVKEETITRVPNTPPFVEGVVDLRGQITTILNPKETIGKNDTSPGDLIIVFDSESFEDQGHIGWVVDDVRQVSPITDSEVNDPPVKEEYVNGVIDRGDDEQFVIWITPEMAIEEAE